MLYKFLFSFALSFIGVIATAQTLQTWTWDTYKVEFKAPNDLDLKRNDASQFEVGNDNMYLDIYPRKGENLTYSGMKNALIKWANDLNLSYDEKNVDGDTQPIYLENLNGYWGCAIDGQSNGGLPATIMLIVDPDYTDISFYVWINYKHEFYHDAVTVLKSFTPIK
ncbi:MAG TPA: hypothetical protein VG847_02230 [Chitinophagaceae bacterium]|nr:hypothetical protein [Chitinophagaceae bacterium]